jgi:hypothetical protein
MRFDIASELTRLRAIHEALPRSAGPHGPHGPQGPHGPRVPSSAGPRSAGPHRAPGPKGRESRFLEQLDIASALDGVPLRPNPHGYVWTAPRYSRITHAVFSARNGKPDLIDLYSDAPPDKIDGRVVRFKVPFVHTTNGTFFRSYGPEGKKKKKISRLPWGSNPRPRG